MSTDTDASLCSDLFVFNSTLSKSEHDEDKKILFYHPAPTPLDQQHISIGLCEAVIHFVQFVFVVLFSFFFHPHPFQTHNDSLTHTDHLRLNPFNRCTRRSERFTCTRPSRMCGG